MYVAWSCALPMSPLHVTVSSLSGNGPSGGINKISFKQSNGTLSTWFYGSQQPVVEAEQQMELVKDLEQTQLGPAWFFQIPYNKIVVVPENTFSLSSNKKRWIRRDDHDDHLADWKRKSIAQPGEKPWFCFWNGTLLETFIYVNHTSGSAFSMTTPAANKRDSVPSPTATASSETSAVSVSITSTAGSPQYTKPVLLPSYPNIIKVEERRLPNSPTPYCSQMEIQPDGTAVYSLDDDNNPITIDLNETEPVYNLPSRSKRGNLGNLESWDGGLAGRQSTQQCTCVWLTS
jgi:hypothetical protein